MAKKTVCDTQLFNFLQQIKKQEFKYQTVHLYHLAA